jgi:hypothetical protein
MHDWLGSFVIVLLMLVTFYSTLCVNSISVYVSRDAYSQIYFLLPLLINFFNIFILGIDRALEALDRQESQAAKEESKNNISFSGEAALSFHFCII